MNQAKKNQISFKLDLSKCKNDQDDDNFEIDPDANFDDDEANFEIPGLNFVKVTDDSFRQKEYIEQSKRDLLN